MKRTIMASTRIVRNIYAEYAGKTRFPSSIEEDEFDKITNMECNKCHIVKKRSDFANNTCGSLPFGADMLRYKRGECKPCGKKDSEGVNIAKKLAKEKGLPTKAPEGTKCVICGSTEKIVFDHDHETNEFRGWLCDPCNRSIGVLGDSATRIANVFNYLNGFEKKQFKLNENSQLEIDKNTEKFCFVSGTFYS